MTVSTYAKGKLLDGLPFDHVSVHDGFPGTIGANEIVGSTRTAIQVNLASGGQRTLAASVSIPVPACTVRWLGFWDSGNFLFALPNGGATPRNFMWTPDELFIRSASHGYGSGQAVVFFQGTPPAALVEGTTYYVRDQTAHKFNVAATVGGAAIVLTTAPSFGCIVAALNETVYAAPSSHPFTAFTGVLPD